MSDLTVVIPTIMRPSLVRAIDSVMGQTIPTELVVVSDVGRMGTGPTMNRATFAVSTPYVGFLGDDDTIVWTYHEWFEEENDGCDLFIFPMEYADGGVLPKTTDPSELRFSEVGGSFILKREVVQDFGFVREDPARHYHEDWEMIDAVRAAGGRIQISERVGYHVRW